MQSTHDRKVSPDFSTAITLRHQTTRTNAKQNHFNSPAEVDLRPLLSRPEGFDGEAGGYRADCENLLCVVVRAGELGDGAEADPGEEDEADDRHTYSGP